MTCFTNINQYSRILIAADVLNSLINVSMILKLDSLYLYNAYSMHILNSPKCIPKDNQDDPKYKEVKRNKIAILKPQCQRSRGPTATGVLFLT